MRRVALLLLLVTAFAGSAHADPQRFVIFFIEWSAAIDDAAKGVVAEAADYAKAHPTETIQVTGFADPTGSKQANVLLSELRAQRVADLLAEDGVPPARIRQVGRGSVKFALTPLESRRVEVAISPAKH
ncbi:MAG: hypothetical protein BGO51_19050 [Rhodospirillales bacterium 69-11]|nr:OmpA family protein [Rhodospirillales bacterium]OJW28580.1 MAG: hypothetical protein BGO51_19050 [Rhodospirillales bacterium 69-11]